MAIFFSNTYNMIFEQKTRIVLVWNKNDKKSLIFRYLVRFKQDPDLVQTCLGPLVIF